MMYRPHILQKKISYPAENDEFGRPLGKAEECWVDLCPCRCDDNSTKEFKSANGEVYRPSFHIVCGERATVKAGDEIRCKDGESIRGCGRVYMVKNTNYLGYSEIWV